MDYGLIGEKLGHSYSKEIHEELASYTYDLCPLSKDEFPAFMEKRDFKAINVTIPYKKMVIPYLKKLDDGAASIGAVNTIVNRNGDLYGYNTDYLGFLYMCRKHDIDMQGKDVLVLGNGGAAQAVKAAVRSLKAGSLTVVDVVDDGESITYDEAYRGHADVDIIINTSPVGMYPDIDASPIDLSGFKKAEAVLDVIYNPLSTKLVLQARDLKKLGVTGLEMLIAQAKYAVEIFIDTAIDDTRIDEIYQRMCRDLQ